MKLLSELELRDMIDDILEAFSSDVINTTEESTRQYSKQMSKKLLADMFKRQQQAWGEYVIGEDERTADESNGAYFGDAFERNVLRHEQRKRNAGKEKP